MEQVINDIRELHAQHKHVVRAMIRGINSVYALARRFFGYQTMLPKKERDEISTLARKSVDRLLAGKGLPAKAVEMDFALVLGSTIVIEQQARTPYEERKVDLEKLISKQVKQLPIWDFWAKSVKGLGPKGLGAIIGECGNLSNYDGPAKLWKRMGLAPLECYRDVTNKGKVCYKVPRERRSLMWNRGQPLIKAVDEYYNIYSDRKAVEAEKALAEGFTIVTTMEETVNSWQEKGLPTPLFVKKFDKTSCRTCSHITKRAQRFMEKRFLRDLWVAWRDCN
jgi:hypothetical protein